MQHLLFKIAEYKYIEWHHSYQYNDSVIDLFQAHLVGVEQLREFSGIMIMDCIYRTNRYNYPLLEIIDVTSTHMSFVFAFIFFEREKHANYVQAMDKLHGLFINKVEPTVIITNREFELANTVESVFSSSRHLLCR